MSSGTGDALQGEDPKSLPLPSTPTPALRKLTPKDFTFIKSIGEGSFSTVFFAKEVLTSKEYAIKVCEKRHIVKEKKQAYVRREKEILTMLNANPSPLFVKLFCTFQDTDRLYFVLTFAPHGDLLPYIHKVGCFDAQCTRFYSGEVLLGLEHLHSLGVIHRDIKPENVLLNEHMHVMLTDFGSAKIIDTQTSTDAVQEDDPEEFRPRRNSFVGTADYVPPELLTDKMSSKSSDLWALGCFIYQLLAGLPPFHAPNEYLIFQKIARLEYEFPDGFDIAAKELVKQLLIRDPDQRVGTESTGGFQRLKQHPFYAPVKFETLLGQTPPPILPYLPATKTNEECRSTFRCAPALTMPDASSSLEPGLDDQQFTRLTLGLSTINDAPGASDADISGMDQLLSGTDGSPGTNTRPHQSAMLTGAYGMRNQSRSRKTSTSTSATEGLGEKEQAARLALQIKENPIWHAFVENHLILRQGLVDKRKGLFARRRMLLLTTGPRLYYVDPVNMVLKGKIPWSPELRPEAKNFKTFFVHTPNRTYYLEDSEGYALEWCRAIDDVRLSTYSGRVMSTSQIAAGTFDPTPQTVTKPVAPTRKQSSALASKPPPPNASHSRSNLPI